MIQEDEIKFQEDEIEFQEDEIEFEMKIFICANALEYFSNYF